VFYNVSDAGSPPSSNQKLCDRSITADDLFVTGNYLYQQFDPLGKRNSLTFSNRASKEISNFEEVSGHSSALEFG